MGATRTGRFTLWLAAAAALAASACTREPAHPASAPAPAPEPERAAPPGTVAHVQRLFTLALPAGFERVRHDDSGRRDARAGENVVRFEDGRGRFLAVAFDEAGYGFSADAVWTVTATSEGGVDLVAEEPPCERRVFHTSSEAAEAEDVDDCPAGDGRLTIAATAEVRGHRYVFFFGDSAHERGVDVGPFRAALGTFHAR